MSSMVLITVDHNSKIPLYRQIREQIIREITAGNLKPGESLPPSRLMAGMLEVNFHTVNRAYECLRDEGLIKLSRGKKYTISSAVRSPKDMEDFETIERGVIAEALAKGLDATDIMQIVKKQLRTQKHVRS